jgi:RNA polymerase sigma-70 factor (ECF subfamily)
MASEETRPAPETMRAELDARFRGPLMRFFLRRVRDRAEAEDLTQEVLLRAIAASNAGRIERAPAYVFSIAVNLLRDRRRQVVRGGTPIFVPLEDALASELESQLLEDFSPERVLLSKDSLADALRTLDELGERTRNIFILFRIENMKQKDIAALYGIAQSTVEKHVMRAVLHLATRYDERD